MDILCSPDFYTEYNRLIKHKPYQDLPSVIGDYFFDKTIDQLKSGTRLNGSNPVPFIKKRLEGRGGYRIYYYLILKDDFAFLCFIHPKTGPSEGANITPEMQKKLSEDTFTFLANHDYYKIGKVETGLEFKHCSELETPHAKESDSIYTS